MTAPLVKRSLVYGVGAAFQRGLGLLLLPLYAHFLTLREYGALALLNLLYQLCNRVLLMGVDAAAMRHYFEPGVDRRRLYGAAFAWTVLCVPLGAFVLAPVALVAGDVLLPSLGGSRLCLLVVAAALFVPVINLRIDLFRAQERARAFVTFQAVFLTGQAVAIAVGVAGLRAGLAGQLWGRLAANAAFWIVAAVSLHRFGGWAADRGWWKRLLGFGLPLVPFFLFAWANRAAGRFFLEHFASLESVGLYALAAQFSGVLLMAGNAADRAIVPHFYRLAKDPAQTAGLRSLAERYTASLAVAGLAGAAVAEPVALLLTPSPYHAGAAWIAPLTAGTWLFLLFKPFQWSLTEAGRTRRLSAAQGVGFFAA
ncbi:MAG: oligosaccharide flippase family protein, partial [Planctomycetota bacterium]|nr:oligosaccharide flippase family protein [Planctomycetota bacterium]